MTVVEMIDSYKFLTGPGLFQATFNRGKSHLISRLIHSNLCILIPEIKSEEKVTRHDLKNFHVVYFKIRKF